jgi:superfamily II DNA/RNA helicase
MTTFDDVAHRADATDDQSASGAVPFADLGLPTSIVERLHRQGKTNAFPIQAAVIPDALAGRDVAGRAPTGSGKTLGFGLPLVAGLVDAAPRRPVALVLAPTRELAEQITTELAPFARAAGHAATSIYGGVGYGGQRKALDAGAELVVACPGRLEDLISMRAVDLRDVAAVVVDEADQMADMGFLPAVRRIVGATAPNRQVMLFSATLDGPVATLVADFQRDPARHEVGPKGPDVHAAEHHFWIVDRTDRVATTAAVIERVGATIVFTRTRHGADRLAKQLGRLGVATEPIHGGRSQGQRDRALDAFKRGAASALIATDVAARGIHVDGVRVVVHFDPPADGATYLHRSGRTARAGATGTVVSLLDTDQRTAARTLQREVGLDVPTTPPSLDGLVTSPPPEHSDTARTRRSVAGEPTTPRRAHRSQPSSSSRHERRIESVRRDVRSVSSHSNDRRTGDGDGTVKFFNPGRGYGFIRPDEGGADLFVHFSNIVGDGFKSLPNDSRVAYEVRQGKNGPEAFSVRAV